MWGELPERNILGFDGVGIPIHDHNLELKDIFRVELVHLE